MDREQKKIQGEHLIDYPKEYHYAISIGDNINPAIVGKGSAIFLHCKGERDYTAGCIAVDEKVMTYLLKNLNTGAYIKLNCLSLDFSKKSIYNLIDKFCERRKTWQIN